MELDAHRARALLARAQRLTDAERSDGASVAEVARAVVGLQAQDLRAASLGVRARLAGSRASAVEAARLRERTVVRVWCMRGTLHLVAAEDARWLVALLGPVGLSRGRRRRSELGVSTPEAVSAVREVLGRDGPLNRHELAAAVRAQGVRIADDPQSPVHLVACAALEGHVCEAGVRDGEPIYARIDDWLGTAEAPLGREADLSRLARRYVTAHPAAGPEDLAAWSGLGVREARRAFGSIASDLDEVRVLDRAAWVPRGTVVGDAEAPALRLLPAFDGLLLAHRDRSLTVGAAHARDVLPGGGVLRPTVLVSGRVKGTWRLERGEPQIAPFEAFGQAAEEALPAEVADVARHRTG